MQPWVCFSSSSGETFRALYTQLSDSARASLKGFFVDRSCGALEVARSLLPHEIIFSFDRKSFETKSIEKLLILSKQNHSELCVFLCGFFGILSSEFLNACPGPIVNTHPSLLPSFPGLDQKVHQKVFETVPIGGFSVHFVTEELDGGPVLFQHPVLLEPHLSWEENRSKVRSAEQRCLPPMLETILEARFVAKDRKENSLELRRRLARKIVSFSELNPPKLEPHFQFKGSSHVV